MTIKCLVSLNYTVITQSLEFLPVLPAFLVAYICIECTSTKGTKKEYISPGTEFYVNFCRTSPHTNTHYDGLFGHQQPHLLHSCIKTPSNSCRKSNGNSGCKYTTQTWSLQTPLQCITQHTIGTYVQTQ